MQRGDKNGSLSCVSVVRRTGKNFFTFNIIRMRMFHLINDGFNRWKIEKNKKHITKMMEWL